MSDPVTRAASLPDLIAAKEAGERAADVDAILAAFVDEPVFEFHPIGRRLVGPERVGLLYEHMLADFMPRIVRVEVGITLSTAVDLMKEQSLRLRLDDGTARTFQTVVVTGTADGGLWGQRFYAATEFFRLLLGELLEDAERTAA
jgi:hypothetical protein